MEEVRRWLSAVLELLLWLVGLLTLLQVLFGESFTAFFGIDVVGNIGELAQKFGNAGLIGIVAAGLIAWLIVRNRPERPRGTPVSPEPPDGT